MAPKAYERHAWVLLLVMGFGFLLFGTVHLVTGRPVASGLAFLQGNVGMTWSELVAENPEMAHAISGFIRVMAVFDLGLFVLYVSMVATSYRRGERWAWYAAWVFPGALVGFIAIGVLHGGWPPGEWWVAPSLGIVMIIVLLGLLLPFRVFFPKKVTSEAGLE